MTQPVTLTNQPVFYPQVCCRCSCGPGPERLYFIDLGVALLEKFDPRFDGSIYYCNLCADNLLVDLNTVISKWRNEHPVEIQVVSTYEWEKDYDFESGTSFDADSNGTELDDSGTDESSGESEESTSISITTVSGTYESDSENVRNDIRLDFGV